MFTATDPHRHVNQVVANGHCVRYCQEVSDVPHTSNWEPGVRVRGGNVPRGTIIATFHPDKGIYENDTDGRSHAAVFLEEREDGLRVLDQWRGHPVSERTIRWQGGARPSANDGDTFYVVEEAHGQG